MPKTHPTVASVTARIEQRSSKTRAEYLRRMDEAVKKGPQRGKMNCANFAHAVAATSPAEKSLLRGDQAVNVAIVTAYNDMLSAHQPLERFPAIIKKALAGVGAVGQVAGGVPAMCDGVTQGQPGMDLSLFSRDVIAMGTAIALSHNVFDAALCLGVCDKIVPGLLIGALHFGHLPIILVPAGPMSTGISNDAKAEARQQFAAGKLGKPALLESEMKCFHGPGTCTFFGTANSNQMLMEMMGVHLPGASFVPPNTPLRDALTEEASRRVAAITSRGREYIPLSRVISERSIVNGIVGLLATGGSTNHTIHLVAVARAAGITINWDDYHDLSSVVPTLARIYPAGKADVNDFQDAGGLSLVIRELLSGGLLHEDVETVAGRGLSKYAEAPGLTAGALTWSAGPSASKDASIIASLAKPFAPDGGLKLLTGNLGRAILKTSALKPEHRAVRAPALVFNDQDEVQAAFTRGELNRDFIAVVRYQGPRARGMPELHRLTPALAVLQEQGYKVGLVTDGRMSGASGKVPTALHVTPECLAGGPLALVQNGDIITLDGERGVLSADVSDEELARRRASPPDLTAQQMGVGRELFGAFRRIASGAELGAVSWLSEE